MLALTAFHQAVLQSDSCNFFGKNSLNLVTLHQVQVQVTLSILIGTLKCICIYVMQPRLFTLTTTHSPFKG